MSTRNWRSGSVPDERSPSQDGEARPNIVLLTTDQHRLDSLGCYGNTVVRTPNLDRLAAAGTTFDNAFTPTAICTPARASLLTGVHPHQHNLLANFERNVGFQEELEPTDAIVPFSRPLAAAGYTLDNVGKWHVGHEKGPTDFGFDGTHFPGWGEPLRHPAFVDHLRRRGLPEIHVRDVIRGTFPNGVPSNITAGAFDGPVEATFSHFLADRTIETIRTRAAASRRDNRPFFVATQFFGPHLPYYLPRAYFDMYDPVDVELPKSLEETFEGKPQVQRSYADHWCGNQFDDERWRKIIAVYWGFVTLIDEQIGRILDVLRDEGLWDETAVLFTSDHGAFVGSHRLQDKGPAMYDDIYRVPLILKVPAGGAGQRRSEFVSLLDIAPTLTSLARAITPDAYVGTDLTPLACGTEGGAERAFITAEFHGHHFPYPQRMIRTRRFKLVVNPPDVDEFYDLQEDPHELANLIGHPAYVQERAVLYEELYEALVARDDKFFHWMTSMCPVGLTETDASLSDHPTDH